MAAIPNVPTLPEELNRKTLEVIEWLVTRLGQGQLTEPQFITGLDTVFMTVSGLVDFELIRTLSEVAKKGRDAGIGASVRYVFVKFLPGDACVLALTWVAGRDHILCSKVSSGSPEVAATLVNCADAADAKKKLGLLRTKLEAKGYTEV
jgi:hypothetical protein